MIKSLFSLIELLIILSIILILISLLQPSLKHLLESANQTVCISIQKNIGRANTFYIEDNNEYLVKSLASGTQPANPFFPLWLNRISWPDQFAIYLDNEVRSFSCPSVQNWGIGINHSEVGRFMNQSPVKLLDIASPHKTVMFGDTDDLTLESSSAFPDAWEPIDKEKGGRIHFRVPTDGWWYINHPWRIYNRHNNNTNVLFVDGSAYPLPTSEIGFQYPKGHKYALWDRL